AREAEVAADAVIDVDDEVPRAEVAEVRDEGGALAAARRFVAYLLAEDLALGNDRETDLGQDESIVEVSLDEDDRLARRDRREGGSTGIAAQPVRDLPILLSARSGGARIESRDDEVGVDLALFRSSRWIETGRSRARIRVRARSGATLAPTRARS